MLDDLKALAANFDSRAKIAEKSGHPASSATFALCARMLEHLLASAPAPAAAEPVGAVYSVHDVGDGKTVTFDLAPGVTLKVGQPLYAAPVPARLQALAGEAEPVAWRYRYYDSDGWTYQQERPADPPKDNPHGKVFEPLYTHPAPTLPAVGDETKQALDHLAGLMKPGTHGSATVENLRRLLEPKKDSIDYCPHCLGWTGGPMVCCNAFWELGGNCITKTEADQRRAALTAPQEPQ
jgi:hypothetical protein